MGFKLRDYQEDSVQAVLDFFAEVDEIESPITLTKKTVGVYVRSCIAELATGAGKSLIVAELARYFFKEYGMKVLCVQPSKELTEQNYDKFVEMTGYPASIFSGSIRKEADHDVIFGTPRTILNEIDRYTDTFNGKDYALLVIDECHKNLQATRDLVAAMSAQNEKLFVLGLSATPYRMGEGFLYQVDETGQRLDESQARKPFFKKKVCEVTAPFLIQNNYLTKPTWGQDDIQYDTSSLVIEKGQFTEESVRQTFEDKDDTTAQIVSDIQLMAEYRKGVMIFGSTIRHCEEICSHLPKGEWAMVTGTTKRFERERIIREFKAQNIKYIVNVQTLTTGFDAPHVDVVAILRATESHALYLQILGRGMRLDKGKEDCLMLDYAGNFDRLELERDDEKMFDIKFELGVKKEGVEAEVFCPLCQARNDVVINPKYTDDFKVGGIGMTPDGFMTTMDGEIVTTDPDGEVRWAFDQFAPHSGRRCKGEHFNNLTKSFDRCDFLWIFRECEGCGTQNDITARQCRNCGDTLINPNEKLFINAEGDVEKSLTQKGKESFAAFNTIRRSEVHATSNLFRSITVDVQRDKGYPQMKIRVDNKDTVVLNFNPSWASHHTKALTTFKQLCLAGFGLDWCQENLNDRTEFEMLSVVEQQWFAQNLQATRPDHPIKSITKVQNKKGYWEIKAFNEPLFAFNPEIDYTEML